MRAVARDSLADDAAALRREAARTPQQPLVWLALADRLDAAGDRAGAAQAYLDHVRHALHDAELMQAGAALHANRLADAEQRLRARLREAPTDVVAIRMFAELAMRLDRIEDAQSLLARCLALAPGFAAARHNHAIVLHRANKPEAALAELETLLRDDPAQPAYRNLQAAVLCRIGEYEQAISIYADLLAGHAQQAPVWLSYGHALKTAGHATRSIEAYERCLAIEPAFGEAWWSLANLKTYRFDDTQLATLEALAARDDLDAEHRLHVAFALGKAREDRAEPAAAFAHYAQGNALRLARAPYSADDTHARFAKAREVYTREFFAARTGSGTPARDPIFIVGLPRSGSTLLEQILASHPQVEGTMELPELISITRALRRVAPTAGSGAYHEALAAAESGMLRELGEQYLANTRVHRKLGRPLFVDKMPNNFAHIGLIQLILPNATIVDARRHPLACCWSNFRQHFARGQNFAYDLADLGRYYRDYVEWMAHVDAVLPGRVHRVIHEDLLDDTEGSVRALLAHCGLPFDAACLRFFDNARPVRTASSEQVRRPINRDGVDQWKPFEPWLDPLKHALGPALEGWAATPR